MSAYIYLSPKQLIFCHICFMYFCMKYFKVNHRYHNILPLNTHYAFLKNKDIFLHNYSIIISSNT